MKQKQFCKQQAEQLAADLGHSLSRFRQLCLEAVVRMILADVPMVPNLVTMARVLREHGLSLAESSPEPSPRTAILRDLADVSLYRNN